MSEYFREQVGHLPVGRNAQFLQHDIQVLLKPGIDGTGARRFVVDVFTFPLPGGFDTPEHHLPVRQDDVSVQVGAQPDHADFSRRHVHETVVVPGAGKARDIRMQDMTVQLHPVILTFQQTAVFVGQKWEPGLFRPDAQNHLVTGNAAAVFQVYGLP